MKPPTTEPEDPPPEPRPRIGFKHPQPPSRYTQGEILLMVAIGVVAVVDVFVSLDPEVLSDVLDWVWRTGTPEAISPGIEIMIGKPPR